MPEVQPAEASSLNNRLDRRLLLSIFLSPIGAFFNTTVGFTVAHWITIAAYKRTGYLVSAVCLGLCAAGALLAWHVARQPKAPDDTLPHDGRQLFMAKLALLLSGFCALVVIAGTFVLITLRPND